MVSQLSLLPRTSLWAMGDVLLRLKADRDILSVKVAYGGLLLGEGYTWPDSREPVQVLQYARED